MKYRVEVTHYPDEYVVEAETAEHAEGQVIDNKYASYDTIKKIRVYEAYCPRCIEDYTDDDGVEQKGLEVKSHCNECYVCEDCEHLMECSKSN